MRLTLYDISANVPDNADFLLVAPNGRSFVIMANAGGFAPQGPVTMNFTDSAGVVVPDNGPLATGATTNSGVPAPAGSQLSEVQNEFGSPTPQANSIAGFPILQSVARQADNFIVPVGETWTINSVSTYTYQAGFAGTTSPFTAASLQIWNGRPGDAGSAVIFGDTTTNRLATSTDANILRVFNTVVGSGGNPPTPRHSGRALVAR